MSGPLAYIGGKNRLAKEIIAFFPEHTTYVELFAGGAQVLFRKQPSKAEILNDLDCDIVNFFRVCQLHYEEFLHSLQFVLVSRQWFRLFAEQNPAVLTDIERAVRFFYLQKNAFAGLVRYPRYAYSVESPRSFNPISVREQIESAHRRLARVQIESLPYETVLSRFDRPNTLFYLDPPYWGRNLYRYNFTEDDFKMLEARLRTIKGRFVLSLNDLPEVRRLFAGFTIHSLETAYTAQKKAGKRFREVLITNFPTLSPN